MHTNTLLLEQFYRSFSQRDYQGMTACYAPNATFADPVFTLKGKQIGAMWHMLCEGGRDLTVRFRDIVADEQQGQVAWEADYTFGTTGRKVHNVVTAHVTFQAGMIVTHRDVFDFWRWSRMALGLPGWALGWTPMLQKRVQQTVQQRLGRFIATHPEYQEV
jgi:ketosteroid isomerase-like protein